MECQLKLYYFDLRARGEPIRWILKVIGCPYEEERISFQEWGKRKIEFNMGTLPTLEVNGIKIRQTTVIARYLGKLHQLAPEDPFDNARIEEIAEGIHETYIPFGTAFAMRKVNKYEAQHLESAQKKVRKIVQSIEDSITDEGWIISEVMTWVDIFVTAYLDEFEYYWSDDIVSEAPKLQKLMKTIREIPAIADWIENRPQPNPFEEKLEESL